MRGGMRSVARIITPAPVCLRHGQLWFAVLPLRGFTQHSFLRLSQRHASPHILQCTGHIPINRWSVCPHVTGLQKVWEVFAPFHTLMESRIAQKVQGKLNLSAPSSNHPEAAGFPHPATPALAHVWAADRRMELAWAHAGLSAILASLLGRVCSWLRISWRNYSITLRFFDHCPREHV
ncbi:hypothetical protein S1001342_01807 [Acetobacter pasteurianus subsp. pasteurianus]|uniref:Uncharacterized protein n=1 Tax=Acetobacter pasteurianus subsp. pasteurianus TaxID=481145 RepID=A0A1Y0XYY6_ACEPA|nr:hypothetical protein S1001342_01807 [Acetobacter pasteurianus subsp. pasteurianus]